MAKAKRKKKKGFVDLYQRDFDNGTYIIDIPGVYKLQENINFRPKGDLDPNFPEQWMYPVDPIPAFRLGFFAAIIIRTNGVTLDLNKKTIQQSEEHALVQRFFSVIELSSAPFLPGTGPANFGNEFVSGNKITIKNGILGRSSHFGIHGNGNVGVILNNLEITKFEVGGIILNNVHSITMKKVHVHSNRINIPLGLLSQSIFLLQAINQIGNMTDDVNTKADALREEVYKYFITGNSELFTEGLTDGSMAVGIAINGRLNVQNFENIMVNTRDPGSYKVNLNDITITDIWGNTTEVATFNMVDPVGSVYNLDLAPNLFSELQIAVAKYALECNNCNSLLRRNTINQNLINWVENNISWDELLENHNVATNRDLMFHFIKGVIGLKIDGTYRGTFKNIDIRNIINFATKGSDICKNNNGVYHFNGLNSRGYTIASSNDITTTNLKISNIMGFVNERVSLINNNVDIVIEI